MRFDNPEAGVSFEVPDHITVRQALAYDEAIEMRGVGMYERLWRGVCVLAQNWECAHVQLSADVLDLPAEGVGTSAIRWAALALFTHMLDLRDLPKN